MVNRNQIPVWFFGLLLLLAANVRLVCAQDAAPLVLGNSMAREAQKDGRHVYHLPVRAGQFARVRLTRRGIHLYFRLFDENGEKISDSIRPTNSYETKYLSLVAERDTTFRVEVEPTWNDMFDNRYEITLVERRAATADDWRRVEAERLLMGVPMIPRRLVEREKHLGDLEKAAAIYNRLGERWFEAVALRSLGQMQSLYGQPEAAISAYRKSIGISRALGDELGEAYTLVPLGGDLHSADEPQAALDTLDEALRLFRKLGERWGQAACLNLIGVIYSDLGAPEKALIAHRQAAAALGRTTVRIRRNLGAANVALGNYAEALTEYEAALKMIDDGRLPIVYNDVMWQIGMLYLRLGDYRKAVAQFEKSLELQTIENNLYSLAQTLNGLGETHYALGEREKAFGYFQKALTVRLETGDRKGESLTRFRLARLKADQDDLPGALREIERAIELRENFRAKIAGDDLRTSFFASMAQYYELYVEILFRLHQKQPAGDFDRRAFLVSERARARSLVELLRDARADLRRDAPADLLKKERDLQIKINDAATRQIALHSGEYEKAEAAEIEKTLQILTGEMSEIRTQIRRANPHYAALTQDENAQRFSVEDLQREILDADTILLEYKLGAQRSFVWVVTKDSLQMFELPDRAAVENSARRVYENLTARNRRQTGETPAQKQQRVNAAETDLPKAVEDLSRMILAPVAPLLKQNRVVVVPDGALQFIPFALLKVPSPNSRVPSQKTESQISTSDGRRTTDDGQYLIETNEIINLPSASVLGGLRDASPVPADQRKTIAVLADPVFDAGDARLAPTIKQNVALKKEPHYNFARLLFARREAKAIAAIAPAETLLALDFEANKTNATGKNLANYRIVHFATHGVLDAQNPEFSGLAFSMFDRDGKTQNGFLPLSEIYSLRLPSELVVLSGCETGLGKDVRGEGLIGLTRGFMYAGARRVAASLWQVDDAATASMMTEFYAAMLGEKQTPAQALRRAQLAMLKQKRWQSPYFWAAFTVQGDWRQ